MPTPDFNGALWKKSSFSNEGGTDCVELATAEGWLGVRDSKLGSASPVLVFEAAAAAALFDSLKES